MYTSVRLSNLCKSVQKPKSLLRLREVFFNLHPLENHKRSGTLPI